MGSLGDALRTAADLHEQPGRVTAGELRQLASEADKLALLASLVTVRQAIEGGDEYIEAAGLNPWCLNEGLAKGDERITSF